MSCPPAWGSRCRACPWPISGPKRFSGGWWSPSPRRRSGGGCRRMPSAPGRTGAGSSRAIPTLAPGPDGSWTCTRDLDPYTGEWEGKPLGQREFVLCAEDLDPGAGPDSPEHTPTAGTGHAGGARMRPRWRPRLSRRLGCAPAPPLTKRVSRRPCGRAGAPSTWPRRARDRSSVLLFRRLSGSPGSGNG